MAKSRAIVWATGRVGKAFIREILLSERFELVGVWAHSAEKHGMDAGELVGLPPCGIHVTTSKQEIYDLPAEIVLQAPKGHDISAEHDADVIALLRSGKNVISLRGYEYPWMLGDDYVAPLEQACAEGGSTLYATGNNPGFIGDRLLTTLMGGCLHLDGVVLSETYDCSNVDPSTFARMGFGCTPEQYRTGQDGEDRDYHFSQTMHVVVSSTGAKIDRIRRTATTVLAEAEEKGTTLPVAAGTIKGIAISWTAEVEGRDFMELHVRWYVGDPVEGWPVKTGWVLQTRGQPPLKLDLAYDGVAPDVGSKSFLPGIFLNAAPEVIRAEPGIMRTRFFAPYLWHG
jgi:2,4-diaminopentanoate dehydrogenase